VGVEEHGFDAGVQFLPARIKGFGAGERVEAELLNAMDELARLTVGGDKVIPAAVMWALGSRPRMPVAMGSR